MYTEEMTPVCLVDENRTSSIFPAETKRHRDTKKEAENERAASYESGYEFREDGTFYIVMNELMQHLL